MDYRPLNPINPISYSQETLVNTLLTDTDCIIQPSNTSSVHTPTYHISTDNSRTPGTGDFGDDTTNNTHLKSLLIPEPEMMKKSASMYAVNTPMSSDSSGYNTGCSNSDTVLLQSPPSRARTASETNCTRTLDLAITEVIHQPKEVCLLSQASIQPLITQTSLPSSDTISTVHTMGHGTQKELPSTLSSSSHQLITSTTRIKNTLGPDNSTTTMSCSTQGSSANINSHSTLNLPRHGHNSTTYDSNISSTCNRTSLETIHKEHSHLVENLTDQTLLNPSVIIIEHSSKNDVDKKMTTLQRCDGRVSGSHDSTTCDSIDTNCVVADTEMMIITTRATIGSPHHFNLGSPTTNTSSGNNSLMDYAGYLHIESPL